MTFQLNDMLASDITIEEFGHSPEFTAFKYLLKYSSRKKILSKEFTIYFLVTQN